MVHLSIAHTEYDDALKKLLDLTEKLSFIEIEIVFFEPIIVNQKSYEILLDLFLIDFLFMHLGKEDLSLITDELINNAIEHGSTPGDLDTCIIRAGRKPDGAFTILLEVHDTGNGKDGKKANEMQEVKIERGQSSEKNGVYMEKRGRLTFSYYRKAGGPTRIYRK